MQLLHALTLRLGSVYPDGEASALARWVMEERFGLSLTDLMLDKDNDLSAEERRDLENITERLLQREPIQYILGQTSFCNLTFRVAPGVLIPRPETQELVEWICEEHQAEERPSRRVLDIGTGSGCIALSLAHRGFSVEAWDVSEEALRIARDNADRLALSVVFRKEDILQEHLLDGSDCQWDVIVSNPPYICQRESAEMEANVLEHEPHLALFVPDEDPLLFYRHIARFAARHLTLGGRIYFEINRAYAEETCRLLEKCGFSGAEVRRDQFDNPRMVRAIRSSLHL